MDPAMMKLAMEQMGRMTPEQMRQMQQMAANMDPAQMAQAQAMMSDMTPEQIREMQAAASGMGGMGGMGGAPPAAPPPQVTQPAAAADGPVARAMVLKEQGNKLHTAGSYQAASAKYNQARRALGGDPSAAGRALSKACLLNLASCALKLERHGDAVQHCTDVLAGEPKNVKALYRRGQALLALDKAGKAVLDLEQAVRLSSADDAAVMREVLQRARAQLPAGTCAEAAAEGDDLVTIEDITADEEPAPAPPPPQPAARPPGVDMTQMAEMMRSNPSMVSMMEGMVGNMSQEQLDAMAAATGQPRITPEQAKAQIAAMKSMGPEAMQTAAQFSPGSGISQEQLARSAEMLQANPALMQQSLAAMRGMSQEQREAAARAAGLPPGALTEDRLEEISTRAASMTPEQLQQAARTAAAANASQADSAAAPRPAAAAASSAPSSTVAPAAGTAAMPGAPAGMAEMLANPDMMSAVSSMMANMTPEDMQAMTAMAGSMGGAGAPGGGAGGMPPADLMAKMASPEMTGMMQRMMKDMPPEQLASMMHQSGMDVTPEQAAQMKAQMDKLSPWQIQMLMSSASSVQRCVLAAQRAKAYLAARPLLAAAIVVLLLALLLRWLGWA